MKLTQIILDLCRLIFLPYFDVLLIKAEYFIVSRYVFFNIVSTPGTVEVHNEIVCALLSRQYHTAYSASFHCTKNCSYARINIMFTVE
jgi:hypothetical protein